MNPIASLRFHERSRASRVLILGITACAVLAIYLLGVHDSPWSFRGARMVWTALTTHSLSDTISSDSADADAAESPDDPNPADSVQSNRRRLSDRAARLIAGRSVLRRRSATAAVAVLKPVPGANAAGRPGLSTSVDDAMPVWPPTIEQVSRELGPFFDLKSVEPTLRAKAVELLVNQPLELNEIVELSRQEGLTDADRNKLMTENTSRLTNAIRELLGPQTASDLFGYRVAERLTLPFAQQCSANDLPISLPAYAAITLDFSHHSCTNAPPAPLLAATWPATVHDQDVAALAEAEKVLTPAQLSLFRQFWSRYHNRPLPGP